MVVMMVKWLLFGGVLDVGCVINVTMKWLSSSGIRRIYIYIYLKMFKLNELHISCLYMTLPHT